MEAVPRLHMLWFALKSSPVGTSFLNLKKYIAEFYQEDPESYSKEVFALETLRNQAMHPTKDGCSVMKRYYCQLHALQNRFPQLAERGIFTFTWKDLYQSNINELTDVRYELAAVLFNIAASHTQVGASVTRGDVDGMKLACTHFQCAAWAFGELRGDRYASVNSGGDFMTAELLVFMQQVSFAQAQECILEKSLIDNRKPNIVAKVTAQIVVYYGAALAALLTGGDDGPISQVIDSSVYKLWKKYVRFKISYLNCILYLYQGQHSEEQKKMGERVTLYQAAWEKLEDARKESKGLPDQKEINESLVFTADVVEAKRKNAKNENEFIYHEAVPELGSIGAVQGANLVNGISFTVTDPEVAGDDLFARLVPMKAHEASSMYSEEKAKLLRKYGGQIEENDTTLASFMSSLTLEHLNINEEKANKIPQGIVDRCAALNANKTAIPDLIAAMSQLAEICSDVELNLKEIGSMLADEEHQEREFQSLTGVQRTPNAHITELTREFQKYTEAHARAGESNDTLRKAMELHVNNLKILARPLADIQQSVPKLSSELNTAEIFKEVKLILNKVNEMKAQRSQFHADLRIAVNEDDITAKVIAHGSEEGLQSLFVRELSKHERLTQLIDQNLLAQKNILQALTDSYAKAAPILKTLADVKHKRESFFSSLAASYDVYEDLLAKSAKGLEFYKKLSGNVQKLLTRYKSARDVQSEERQQRLKNSASNTSHHIGSSPHSTVTAKDTASPAAASPATASNTPKLRDYLKAKNTSAASIAAAGVGPGLTDPTMISSQYIPPIRPNPLGSENPTQAVCSSGYYTAPVNSATPNEPPPPYSLQQMQFYDPSAAGYTNPMYQQQQQNMPPPAYTLQASPNSQFNNMSANMANLSLQQQQQLPEQYASSTNMPSGSTYTQQQPQINNIYGANMSQPTPNYNYMNNQPANMSQPTSSYIYGEAQQSLATSTYPLQNPYMPGGAALPAAAMYPQPVDNTGSNQYTNMYDANSCAVSYQQPGPVNVPEGQQMYSTQQPPTNYASPQSVVGTAATIPTTQPLYVATSNLQHETAQAPPPSLQAPYVVNNPMLPPTQQQYPTTNMMIPTSETPSASEYSPHPNMSTTKHPGYSFNPQTGTYEYGSGYHQAGAMNTQFYGQYTSASAMQQMPTVGTTNSENASKSNVATGFDSPIVSHTKSGTTAEPEPMPTNEGSDVGYYTRPYGYQSNGSAMSPYPADATTQDQTQMQPQQQPQQPEQQQQQHSFTSQPQQHQATGGYPQQATYMQSGSVSIANTQTTKSAAEYASSAQQMTPTPVAPAAPTQPMPAIKKSSNIDLLTDIDFSAAGLSMAPPILPAPVLKPEVVPTSPPVSQVAAPITPKQTPPIPKDDQPQLSVEDSSKNAAITPPPLTPSMPLQLSSPLDSPAPRKSSYDNLSICSDLSSLDNNFDWDSVSMRSEKAPQHSAATSNDKHSTISSTSFLLRPLDPFADDKTLKYFHKEVERYEKTMESLNVKMLNGNTQLSAKWKELQELLTKESSKRTTTIAKLFPEKNRSLDCLPYDHARVKLEKNTDDYINAAYIKNLGPGCPNFIIAQTPQQNTVHDFWSMIWSQKARSVVCLHTPNEMLDPFWPQELNTEAHFDDYSVKCVKINALSHCSEYNLKLSMHGADAIIDLSVLQIRAWTKSSPTQVIGIARNTLQTHQKRCLEFNTPTSPLIMNCLTGSERSELVAIAICTILATETKRPVLINVVDMWYRICAQRQNALRDSPTLEQSMQIVLNHAHDVLNKRGIMTSYQMKIAPQVASKEKQEIKDPLNELDPLWKLK